MSDHLTLRPPPDGTRTLEPLVRSHTCDHCGKVGEWGKGWHRWGSALLAEYGKELTVCSDDCQSKSDVHSMWFKKFGETVAVSESQIGNFG